MGRAGGCQVSAGRSSLLIMNPVARLIIASVLLGGTLFGAAMARATANVPEPQKCWECIGGACHMVQGIGSMTCVVVGSDCICDGNCG